MAIKYLTNIDVNGNVSVTENVLAKQIKAEDGSESTTLYKAGVVFDRSSSYLRPISNNTKNLNIGGFEKGQYDWGAIKLYTDSSISGLIWNDEVIGLQKDPLAKFRYSSTTKYGFLVATDIPNTISAMFVLKVFGNGYSQEEMFDIKVQGYQYITGDNIIQVKGTTNGTNPEIKIFNYNGFLHFHVEQTGIYQSPGFTVHYTNAGNNSVLSSKNRVTTVDNAVMPTTGVSRLVTADLKQIATRTWVEDQNFLTFTDVDLSNYLLNTTDTFTGQLSVAGTIKATNAGNTAELSEWGIDFDRSTNYLRPVASDNGTSSLRIGIASSNEWGNVYIETNGSTDFKWNSEVVATQDWVGTQGFITDANDHANRTILDKFGENGSGIPTYNGVTVDTTIAQRDVYDGLDSSDNTISLSAKQGKVLKDVQDTQQIEIDLNTAKVSYPGDQDLSGYVTKAESQTITGQKTFNTGSYNPLKLDRSSANINMSFNHSGILKGYLGVGATGLLTWGTSPDSAVNAEVLNSSNINNIDIDADKVDGYHATSFLRSDDDDSFSGKLASTTKDGGLYGTYAPSKIDSIWSMGTAFKVASDGSDFGNLYGLAYYHPDNGQGSFAGGHQIAYCANGVPKVVIGNDIWTSRNVIALGGDSTEWNQAYGWGDHSTEGYLTSINWDEIGGDQEDIGLADFDNNAGFITSSDISGKANLTGGNSFSGPQVVQGSVSIIKGSSIVLDSSSFSGGDDFNYIKALSGGDSEYASSGIHHFKNGEDESYETVKAGDFIKDGGTSSQFLKADGSVDDNVYQTSSDVTSSILSYLDNYTPIGFSLNTILLPSLRGNVAVINSSSSKTITVNTNSLTSIGDIAYLDQDGSGEITIVAGTGVTLQVNSSRQLKTDGQYSRVAIHKVATSTYRVFGELKSV